MVKAVLNGVVIAETDKYEVVEGNKYFPPESLVKEYFTDSDTQYVTSFFLRAACRLYFFAVLPARGKGNVNCFALMNVHHSRIPPDSRLTTTFLSPTQPKSKTLHG